MIIENPKLGRSLPENQKPYGDENTSIAEEIVLNSKFIHTLPQECDNLLVS